ncbi:hypothetical protein FLA105534_00204 [Flavobacterium bizetiae]|nr:hypothetical protein FLA105534_00204 [Flavobacterium bizetiae]
MVNFPAVNDVSLLLTIGTAVPVTPFTVVLKLFTADVFETVVAFAIAVGVSKLPPSEPTVKIFPASVLVTCAVVAVPASLV